MDYGIMCELILYISQSGAIKFNSQSQIHNAGPSIDLGL